MGTTTTFIRHGITLPVDGIAELCRKYDVVELSVSGHYYATTLVPKVTSIFWSLFTTTTASSRLGRKNATRDGYRVAPSG